mgnify:CR=1 FL=1
MSIDFALYLYFCIAVGVQVGLLRGIDLERLTILYIITHGQLGKAEKSTLLNDDAAFKEVQKLVRRQLYKNSFWFAILWPYKLVEFAIK